MTTTIPSTERCRSCNAPIIWAKHATTGDPAPLDAEPTKDGTWGIEDQLTLAGDVERVYHQVDAFGHRNHFSTCPHADQWRRRGPAREPA